MANLILFVVAAINFFMTTLYTHIIVFELTSASSASEFVFYLFFIAIHLLLTGMSLALIQKKKQ